MQILELGIIDYLEAWNLQQELVQKRRDNLIEDTLVFAGHPPVFTIGRAGRRENILAGEAKLREDGFELYYVDRGGDVTYHYPGQLTVYPILNLRHYYCDLHWYLRSLEEVTIRFLNRFGVMAGRNPGLTGVWIGKEKIASIGIGVKHWITYHGLAININGNINAFSRINPCGIAGCCITTLSQELGREIIMEQGLKSIFANSFQDVFQKQHAHDTSLADAHH